MDGHEDSIRGLHRGYARVSAITLLTPRVVVPDSWIAPGENGSPVRLGRNISDRMSPRGPAAQLGFHGTQNGLGLERDDSPPAARRRRGPGELGGCADTTQGSPAAHGCVPHGPAIAGPNRPRRCPPGGVPGSL